MPRVPTGRSLLYSTLLYSTLLYSTLLYSTLFYSTLAHRKPIENLLKIYWKSIENPLKIHWKTIENLSNIHRTSIENQSNIHRNLSKSSDLFLDLPVPWGAVLYSFLRHAWRASWWASLQVFLALWPYYPLALRPCSGSLTFRLLPHCTSDQDFRIDLAISLRLPPFDFG